jgi:hypothetical protein
MKYALLAKIIIVVFVWAMITTGIYLLLGPSKIVSAEKSRFMVKETFTVFSNGDGALLVDDKFGKEYILVKDVGVIQTR